MPSQLTPIELDSLRRRFAISKMLSGLVAGLVKSEPKEKLPTYILCLVWMARQKFVTTSFPRTSDTWLSCFFKFRRTTACCLSIFTDQVILA